MEPEAIQTIVYSVGKDNGYEDNLREWFKAIYEIIFGDQDGLVSIPSKIINEVVEKSYHKVSQENTVRKELSEGKSLKEVFIKHGIL